MAERRMFTKKVTDDDNFMALSSSAQALYLHLSMSADDDGFCNQVSISMFKAHASIQDLQTLLEKRYIYQFENGVIVIKHWRMANALRKDRYTPTAFQEELKQLSIKDNGAYTRLPDGCQVVAECLPQDSIGKDSIGKDSIGKDSIGKDSIGKDSIEDTASPFDEFPTEVQDAIKSFIDMRKKQKKPMTDNAVKRLLKKLKQLSDNPDEQINILNQSEDACWLDIYPLKQDKQKKSSNNAGDNIFLQIAQEEGLL